MAPPTIRKPTESSSACQLRGYSQWLNSMKSYKRSMNSASTAMPADATAVQAATRRVPACERRRYLRPAMSSGTGISMHSGTMNNVRTTPVSLSPTGRDRS
jgi:hypothetical protein